MLEKLQELFPEMVEGMQWDLAEGGFRNVLDYLESIRVAQLATILDDEKNLPLTHGVTWNELGMTISMLSDRLHARTDISLCSLNEN